MELCIGSMIVSALVLDLAPGVSAALYDQVIKTTHGPVQGYPAFNSTPSGGLTHWKDITVWKGIPFAATTGGENRFKEPQRLARGKKPLMLGLGALSARQQLWEATIPSMRTA